MLGTETAAQVPTYPSSSPRATRKPASATASTRSSRRPAWISKSSWSTTTPPTAPAKSLCHSPECASSKPDRSPPVGPARTTPSPPAPRQARGEWLLFTDADTVHLPGSLAASLKEAQENGAELLSYSPEQIAVTFWEMATLPVVFAELARQYSPSKVSDPDSPIAAANGQYILISREAYEAVGGHAAVAADILEDVALARAVKTSGRKIRFRYAADRVRTRMYRNYRQLRDGWTKNLALLFPNPGWLAVKVFTRWAVFRGLSWSLLTAALRTSLVERALMSPWLSSCLVARFRLAQLRRAIEIVSVPSSACPCSPTCSCARKKRTRTAVSPGRAAPTARKTTPNPKPFTTRQLPRDDSHETL